MPISVEEFNRRIMTRREINYMPICHYIQKNTKSDLFFRVCYHLNHVLENKKVNDDPRYQGPEIYDEGSMRALADSINKLKEQVYQFDFEQFFMMMLYYVPLLKRNGKTREDLLFQSPGHFKTELVRKMNGYDTMVGDARVTTQQYPISNLRRQLYGQLCGLKDNFIFQLRDRRYICVGWCEDNKFQKFFRFCEENKVIDSFNTILEVVNESKGYLEDDDKINFRLRYQNFLDYSYDFLNDHENQCAELAELMTQIDDNDANVLFKELDIYRQIHDSYLR